MSHTPEPCRRCAAFEGLIKAQEAQLSYHREQAGKYREAIATLDSEREANRLLTEQRDKLLAALEGVLAITADSQGVVGYHLNGAVADWWSFEEIAEAAAAIKEVKGGTQ